MAANKAGFHRDGLSIGTSNVNMGDGTGGNGASQYGFENVVGGVAGEFSSRIKLFLSSRSSEMEERKYICANGLDSRYLTVVRFCKVRWYGTYPVWSHVCLVICVCKLEFGIDGLIGFPGSRLGSKQKSFGDIFIGELLLSS
ncbi:hypothetical protein C5167_041995 [Papaver somniferum]|nr:hypothetical protein C5167_041995 [Papaver somniferum]